jgi:hypothetical protein
MTRLVPAQSSRQHFLLPLPPGVAADDPELFGFYSYEFRVGHSGPAGDLRWWSTANARFGAPLRVVGVQHPPPPLTCHAGRYRHEQGKTSLILRALRRSEASPFRVDPVAATAIGKRFIAEHRSPIEVAEDPPSLIVATAPYATPVLNGVPLVQPEDPPRTQLWFFVYAQAVQADGASMRNILLLTSPGQFLSRRQAIAAGGELAALFESFIASEALRDRIGLALFHQAELEALLAEIHLPGSAPLSLLAVELLPAGTVDELHPEPEVELHAATTSGSRDGTFPFGRILRTSPLTPIEPYC